ncbi:MAG: malonic semialdehyde reductase [Rhodospirillaceae bacterium]|nr:MAG: malonic semialdehyde reductase [Rhodospirillaceae bacterium]
MRDTLDSAGQDLIFRKARTQNGWKPEKVAEALMREIYDLMKMGPTSANSSPARFIFIASKAGKEKLKPAVAEGNLAKTMEAPVTVIIGYDTQFYEYLPELFPHAPGMKNYFTSSEAMAQETAFRNGTLQGAYLIIAARALGLDAGPMSGFDPAKVNAAFWPDGRVKANFLCNIGIGDESKLFDRSPRLSFEKACQII